MSSSHGIGDDALEDVIAEALAFQWETRRRRSPAHPFSSAALSRRGGTRPRHQSLYPSLAHVASVLVPNAQEQWDKTTIITRRVTGPPFRGNCNYATSTTHKPQPMSSPHNPICGRRRPSSPANFVHDQFVEARVDREFEMLAMSRSEPHHQSSSGHDPFSSPQCAPWNPASHHQLHDFSRRRQSSQTLKTTSTTSTPNPPANYPTDRSPRDAYRPRNNADLRSEEKMEIGCGGVSGSGDWDPKQPSLKSSPERHGGARSAKAKQSPSIIAGNAGRVVGAHHVTSASTTPRVPPQRRRRHTLATTRATDSRMDSSSNNHNRNLVEIQPGMFLALRGKQETMHAIRNGFVTDVSCMNCAVDLMCIRDCQYVICPDCRIISPMDHIGTVDGGDGSDSFRGGLGLGVKTNRTARDRALPANMQMGRGNLPM